MTTIVNKYKDEFDIYIGRPTIYGNPYEIGKDGTREEVVSKYREYFLERMEIDLLFRTSILAVSGKRLGCFCKPRACHGDVICEYLNGL